jgi:Zn-dependent M28 family amino/carboxypeptidase
VLASDEYEGRRSGTPGGDKAAAYIAKQFEAAGLQPVGDEGTYFQHLDLPGGEADAEASSLTLTGADGKSEVVPMDPLWSAFRGSPTAKIPGTEVVFVGYGIKAEDLGYDDYAGVDVKGKVVLLLRHGPGVGKPGYKYGAGRPRRHTFFQMKLRRAQEGGAAAVILVNDRAKRDADDPDPSLGGGVGRAKIPFVFVKAKIARKLFEASGLDLHALEDEIEETGKPKSRSLTGLRVGIDLVTKVRRTANVLGLVEGSDPKLKEEVVVVGGHYDHLGTDGAGSLGRGSGKDKIWNGADDNASGTAGVIELAEHFALAPERPRRSLLFIAFAAEELGLVGSRYYVDHPIVPIEKTVAMLNMDMIGRSTEGRLFIGGVGTSPAFGPILDAASKGSGLKIRRGQGGAAPSDNTMFFRKDIPCLFFFTGIHGDYHRASDHWDKVNYETQTTIVDIVRGCVRALADLDERPEFKKVTSGGFPGRRRGPYLGVQPDMAAGRGAAIAQVVPGTPAAKAGLENGDRVIKFGGEEIKDWGMLRAALRKRKSKEKVELVVLRGGEEKTLTITLGGS